MKKHVLTCAMLAVSWPAWAQSPSIVLGLDDARAKALAGSPAVAAALAAVQAAEGTTYQAGALPNPEIGLEVENVAGSGPYRGSTAAEYTYSLSQKLEVGGKRDARRNVAGAEGLAARHALEAARLDVARDATVAYGEVLAAQKKLKLAEAREKLAGEVLAGVGRRVGAARDPLIYKSQAEVAQATAVLEHNQARRNVQVARRKLSAMWGETALTAALDPAILAKVAAPEKLETYMARLNANPGLLRLEALRGARENTLKLEQAQAVPDPTLSVGLRDFRENGEQAMLVGVSLPLPLFDRNRGNIARAGANIVEAEQEGRKARLDAGQALHEAWQNWQSAHAETAELATRIVPVAEKALQLAQEGYARGRFSFLEVLYAQRTLAEAQEQHIEAALRSLNASAEVARLTAFTPAPAAISPTIQLED